MKILVTGGTGFIGQTLVESLLSQKLHVRCLLRRSHRVPPGIEVVNGDITLPDTLPDALAGVDLVYHIAGATMVRHPLIMRRVNAQGTRNLALACAAMPTPPRVVYLSSLAAAGVSTPDKIRTEEDPPAPISRYGQSKLAGERAFQAVAERMSASVVRAPSVFGPRDPHTVRLFRSVRSGLNLLPGSSQTRLAWIHVNDLVRVLQLTAERGKPLLRTPATQGIYHVAISEQPTLAEVGDMIAQIMNRPAPRTFAVPRRLCLFGGRMVDLFMGITGIVRLLNFDKMREATAGSWICRTDRACDELGFTCTLDLREAFAQTYAWYQRNGRL